MTTGGRALRSQRRSRLTSAAFLYRKCGARPGRNKILQRPLLPMPAMLSARQRQTERPGSAGATKPYTNYQYKHLLYTSCHNSVDSEHSKKPLSQSSTKKEGMRRAVHGSAPEGKIAVKKSTTLGGRGVTVQGPWLLLCRHSGAACGGAKLLGG